MGHQHHFLSRLDRLSTTQVETALVLYRDPDLVRWVLFRVKLPEGAPRVALSLDDPVRGPFLIVTRDGIFVTALGLNMSPGDLPIIPRGQLDAHLAARSDYRSRLGVFLQIAEERGGTKNVFSRLHYAAEYLTREEMTALSALQPLYEFDLLHLLLGAGVQLEDLRHELLPLLKRAPKLRLTDRTRALLRDYHRIAYLVGHVSVLAGQSGPKFLDVIPKEVLRDTKMASLSWGGVRQGIVVHALRATWLAGRLGRAQFALHKENFAASGTVFTAADSGMALTSIAFRHARYRAEVQKLMRAAVQSPGNVYRGKIAILSSMIFDSEPERIEQMALDLGRALVFYQIARRHPPSSPYAFQREEDVPADLAWTALVNLCDSFTIREEIALPMFAALPWMARAAPEDLYFPRAVLEPLRTPWEPEDTYRLLRPMAQIYKNAPQRPTGARRQGPCPCGSGKKYKRCCEEKDAAKKDAAKEQGRAADANDKAETEEVGAD